MATKQQLAEAIADRMLASGVRNTREYWVSAHMRWTHAELVKLAAQLKLGVR